MQLAWSVIKVINKSIYLRISDMVVIECTAVAGSRPTSSMTSKLTGEGDEADVPKKALQFSVINRDF